MISLKKLLCGLSFLELEFCGEDTRLDWDSEVDVEELASDWKRVLGLAIFTDCRLESLLKIESQSWAPGDSMISSGLVINSEISIELSVELLGAWSMDPREDHDARICEFSSNSFALES